MSLQPWFAHHSYSVPSDGNCLLCALRELERRKFCARSTLLPPREPTGGSPVRHWLRVSN